MNLTILAIGKMKKNSPEQSLIDFYISARLRGRKDALSSLTLNRRQLIKMSLVRFTKICARMLASVIERISTRSSPMHCVLFQ